MSSVIQVAVSGESRKTIFIGCLVGIVSSASQAVGITLQRKSHLLEDSRPVGELRRPAFRRNMWRLGLFLFLISNVVGSSVQITTLPLIILSPLQAVGLVFNSVCATILLNEPFSQLSLLGTVLVSMGAILIAIFGAIAEPQHNLNELLVLLARAPFLAWMALTFVFVICILGAIHWLDRSSKSQIRGFNVFTIKGILYGIVSGVLSAHSLLMAKSAVELAVRGFRDNYWADYFRWQTWLIIGAFLVFALSQLYILNCGLRLCSTSLLYPLVFCVYNITTIMNGLIYFQQTSRLSYSQIFLVATGTGMVFLGVLSLSLRLEHLSAMTSAAEAVRPLTLRRKLSSSRPQSQVQFQPPPLDTDDNEHRALTERQPLLVNARVSNYASSSDENSPRYTSFRSLSGASPSPLGTAHAPTSPFSAAVPRYERGRTLSLEQTEILEQLHQMSPRNNRQEDQ